LITKYLKNIPNKTKPAFFGKAKVNEFVNSENFEIEIFHRPY